jgi:3',5'-cyclic AMP phosphodiesterase CpdA
MKLIVLSDLHIGTYEDVERASMLNKLMRNEIEDVTISDTPLFVLVLGDVVDHQYKPEAFEWARQVLNDIKQQFLGKDVEFAIVPGNHDLYMGSFKEFDGLASEFCGNEIDFSNNA